MQRSCQSQLLKDLSILDLKIFLAPFEKKRNIISALLLLIINAKQCQKGS